MKNIEIFFLSYLISSSWALDAVYDYSLVHFIYMNYPGASLDGPWSSLSLDDVNSVLLVYRTILLHHLLIVLVILDDYEWLQQTTWGP